MPEPVIGERLRSAPDVPGVYLMRGAGGEVLYVGKAASLRARLRSYADPARQGPKTVLLVGQAASVEWFETDTEVEALILEDSLIKQHRPRFNIRQRDDKTYPFLRLSVHEEFPALTVVRRAARDGARYFGPYITAGAMRTTLKLLRRLFPLRLCRRLRPGRPCLNHQMGRCPAPCAGRIGAEEYRERVRATALFLQGRGAELAAEMRKQMAAAADELRFEEAAALRDHVAAIEATLERQRVHDPGGGDFDVVGTVRLGERVGAALLRVRAGRLIGTDAFLLRDPLEGEDGGGALSRVIRECYAGEREVPPEVVVGAEPADAAALGEWLGGTRGARVRITVPRAGDKKALVAMAGRSAMRLLQDERAGAAGVAGGDALLDELGRIAGAGPGLRSLACLDASTLSGTDAVVSLVWWEGGALRRQRYRRFRIRRAGQDDVAMLAEAVGRLAARVGTGSWAPADVVLLDGGRGQLSAGEAALAGAPWRPRLLLAIAKPTEKRGTDAVFVAGGGALALPAGSPVLMLLQRVRDEAHRFAVAYHRTLRSRRLLDGPLAGIPGLGPARRARLLAACGGLRGVTSAPLAELERLLPARVAAAVRAALHPGEPRAQAAEGAGDDAEDGAG